MGFDRAIDAHRGGTVEMVWRSSHPDLALDEHEDALLGPANWLASFAVGDLVSVGIFDGALAISAADEGKVVADEVPILLRHVFDDAVMGDDTAFLPDVAGLVSARFPDVFMSPRPPLGELLTAAGLCTQGDLVARAGYDWDAHWACRRQEHGVRMATDWDLDEIDGVLASDLAIHSVRFKVGDLHAADWEAVATAFSAADVVDGFLRRDDGAFGVFGDDDSIEHVRQFAEATLAHAAWKPAGALLALARCAEWAGDFDAWRKHVSDTLVVDPTFWPALVDAAVLASIQGQASRARAGRLSKAAMATPHSALYLPATPRPVLPPPAATTRVRADRAGSTRCAASCRTVIRCTPACSGCTKSSRCSRIGHGHGAIGWVWRSRRRATNLNSSASRSSMSNSATSTCSTAAPSTTSLTPCAGCSQSTRPRCSTSGATGRHRMWSSREPH